VCGVACAHDRARTGELSTYLKHILGWGDTVKYYQENRSAREQAFGRTAAAGAATKGHSGRMNGDEELMEEVVSSEDTKSFEGVEVWKCQRLVMADHVRRTVFPHTRLWAHADANKICIERCVRACAVCVVRVCAVCVVLRVVLCAVRVVRVVLCVDDRVARSSSNTLCGDPHEEALLGGWQTAEPAAEAAGNGKQREERERRVSCRVDITRVELLLYPLGNGLLLFHLDWKPDPTCPLALDQLRSYVCVVRCVSCVCRVVCACAVCRVVCVVCVCACACVRVVCRAD
jgi:hypothetical protein